MKVIIFGASGKVGAEVLKQSLREGHIVTAFVRNPEKIENSKHPNLIIWNGDVLNIDNVGHALKDQDAVLCALGDGKAGQIRASGTANIIDEMKKKGLKRFVCQTTLGMGESYGNLNFIWKYIMFGILLKKAFHDHQLQEEYILSSDLDYTIVRPSALTDGEITNQYKIGFSGEYKKLNLKISRTDVADFMLRQLKTNEYLKKAVSISH